MASMCVRNSDAAGACCTHLHERQPGKPAALVRIVEGRESVVILCMHVTHARDEELHRRKAAVARSEVKCSDPACRLRADARAAIEEQAYHLRVASQGSGVDGAPLCFAVYEYADASWLPSHQHPRIGRAERIRHQTCLSERRPIMARRPRAARR